MQDDDLPIGGVEFANCFVNTSTTFIRDCFVLWALGGCWAAFTVSKLFCGGLAGFAPAFEVYEFAVGYAVQPGADQGSAAKLADTEPGGGKGLLGQVLSGACMAAEVKQEAVYGGMVPPHEVGEGLSVSCTNGL